eukprot:GABW01000143.1.p2 GENE.GABW01000143.1~~GABW01000143.1.p2  ORF type:complete len:51 (-),score=6.19 GABW01000143.1:118-270(-)
MSRFPGSCWRVIASNGSDNDGSFRTNDVDGYNIGAQYTGVEGLTSVCFLR